MMVVNQMFQLPHDRQSEPHLQSNVLSITTAVNVSQELNHQDSAATKGSLETVFLVWYFLVAVQQFGAVCSVNSLGHGPDDKHYHL